MPRVKYIGPKKPYHPDRIFKSGVIWHGKDDVQEVEDEDLARRMVQYFPSVYKIVTSDMDECYENIRKTEKKNRRPLENVVVQVDGMMMCISDAPYTAIQHYIEKEYGTYIPEGATKKELLEQIEQMEKMKKDYLNVSTENPVIELGPREILNAPGLDPAPEPEQEKKPVKGLAMLEVDDLF